MSFDGDFVLKRLFLFVVIMLSAFTCCGCAIDVGDFDLTESEEEQIVSYSTDILLKHDVNYQNNIVDTSRARELKARVEAIKELNKKAAEEEAETSEKDSKGKDSDAEGKAAVSLSDPVGEQDIAKALVQDGFEINYKGYEVTDRYSMNGSDDDFFALSASAGKELIVLHFDIANVSGEDKQCDLFSHYPIYKVIINGNEKKNALTTFLMNDMSNIDESVAAGTSIDGVVLLETEVGYENNISNVALEVNSNDGNSVIPFN